MFFHMAEYCDTLQSKEKRHRENKVCLNERAILRLLDQEVTWKSGCFLVPERGDFLKNSNIFQLAKMELFFPCFCTALPRTLPIQNQGIILDNQVVGLI